MNKKTVLYFDMDNVLELGQKSAHGLEISIFVNQPDGNLVENHDTLDRDSLCQLVEFLKALMDDRLVTRSVRFVCLTSADLPAGDGVLLCGHTLMSYHSNLGIE